MTRPKGIKAGGYGDESQQTLQSEMAFTPAQSHLASNAAVLPVTVNVPMDIDAEDPNAQAVIAAQEQLRLAMEAQARVLKNREFADAYWREERAEARTMRIPNKAALVDKMEEIAMMLEMRWNHVSRLVSGFGCGS